MKFSNFVEKFINFCNYGKIIEARIIFHFSFEIF